MKKIAFVYDRVNKWGGAERVLLTLHKLFPQAILFTSVYNVQNAPWAKEFTIKTSFLQSIPYASSSHEYLAPLMPIAFEQFDFDKFDLVISITSEAAKGIITKPHTKHICYCLTPTRYLWSGHDEYFQNMVLKTLAWPAISYLRYWDRIASNRPDFYIAISKEVSNRIRTYYNRESDVIYPPLTIENVQNQKKDGKGDYFLVVSRFVPYKRLDIAIEACNRLNLPLKIVGEGWQEKSLRKLAGPKIEFLGNLTDEQLVEYYNHCCALIFPGIEDFGMVIAEAQFFGKPVIAYKGGGALEIVLEGKTGEFFYPQNALELVESLEKFKRKTYDPNDCKANAQRFSFERFKKSFMDYLKNNSIEV